jgi:hypothetical protein
MLCTFAGGNTKDEAEPSSDLLSGPASVQIASRFVTFR